MSVQAMSWAFKQPIPPAQKLVLLVIANSANDEGDNAFPGQGTIAERAGMGERTVRRHVQWLEAHGCLVRIRRSRKDGSRTSDRYILGCNKLFKDRESQPAKFAGRPKRLNA